MIGPYESAAAFRQALEQRLYNLAREGNIPLSKLRKTIVFDRFLARLLIVSSDWVLKGALALDFRFGMPGRTTLDIDLVDHRALPQVEDDLIEAGRVELGDGFSLIVELTEEAELQSARFRVRAELGGRQFDEVLVDIGLADQPIWK